MGQIFFNLLYPTSSLTFLSTCHTMSVFDRSSIFRWRMGFWLLGQFLVAAVHTPHASRNHLLDCLDVAAKLLSFDDPAGVAYLPSPLNFWLN